MAADDDHLLDEVAEAILDGTPIRWTEVDSRAVANQRHLVERLKVLAALADVHRDVPQAVDHSRTAASDRIPSPARWGHLTVLELLGRGAFGQVFRARDTRLDREVALKLIAADSASGDTRATSIIEEGRLMAQVRHPNVVTLYGAQRRGDQVGLWMELVEGRTLEQLLEQGKRFNAAETLEIGVQLCEAIAAVHGAGLLHRDVKSHNVMLSDGGHVVLMDFGTGWNVRDSSEALPAGTPLYLAPELLDGGTPTIRSDIYAVGVLLFHLLTAAYPVSARDLQELRRAHTRNERVNVRSARRQIPQPLRAVIERAIDPRPQRRYESAAAMAADLRSSRSRVSPASWAALTILALAVSVLVAVPALQRADDEWSAASGGAAPTAAIVSVTSTPGGKRHPALSPDGTHVAFVWNRAGEDELHVTELSTGRTLQVSGTQLDGNYPTWSPDGQSIAFYRRFLDDEGHRRAAVRITPLRGGQARTLWQTDTSLLGSGLSWSPDGKHLALSVRPSPADSWRMMLLDVSTCTTQWLTTPPGSDGGDSRPAFSPDGARLAFVRSTRVGSDLHVLKLATGAVRRLSAGGQHIREMTWADQGQSLVYTSYQGGGRDTLWRIAVTGGKAQPLAGIGEGASFPSAARNGGRMVYLQQVFDTNVYRVDLSGGGGPAGRQLASSTRADTSPDISPDGTRIAFASNRNGPYEIWLADADGGNAKQLTALRSTRQPRWSPDSRRIAAVGRVSPLLSSIYVIDVFTGASRRITAGANQEEWPTWSADGRSIYFASTRSGDWQLWKIAADGGEPVQLTHDGGIKPWESSDGSFLYYSDDRHGIWRRAVRGGSPAFVLRLPEKTAYGGEWIPAPDGIYWVNRVAKPRLAIEFFDFRTGRSAPVIVPSGPYDDGSGFSVSKDGRWAVFSQRDYHGTDIMMIDRVR